MCGIGLVLQCPVPTIAPRSWLNNSSRGSVGVGHLCRTKEKEKKGNPGKGVVVEERNEEVEAPKGGLHQPIPASISPPFSLPSSRSLPSSFSSSEPSLLSSSPWWLWVIPAPCTRASDKDTPGDGCRRGHSRVTQPPKQHGVEEETRKKIYGSPPYDFSSSSSSSFLVEETEMKKSEVDQKGERRSTNNNNEEEDEKNRMKNVQNSVSHPSLEDALFDGKEGLLNNIQRRGPDGMYGVVGMWKQREGERVEQTAKESVPAEKEREQACRPSSHEKNRTSAAITPVPCCHEGPPSPQEEVRIGGVGSVLGLRGLHEQAPVFQPFIIPDSFFCSSSLSSSVRSPPEKTGEQEEEEEVQLGCKRPRRAKCVAGSSPDTCDIHHKSVCERSHCEEGAAATTVTTEKHEEDEEGNPHHDHRIHTGALQFPSPPLSSSPAEAIAQSFLLFNGELFGGRLCPPPGYSDTISIARRIARVEYECFLAYAKACEEVKWEGKTEQVGMMKEGEMCAGDASPLSSSMDTSTPPSPRQLFAKESGGQGRERSTATTPPPLSPAAVLSLLLAKYQRVFISRLTQMWEKEAQGPYSFVYYAHRLSLLTFGRDPLGRRSLLLHLRLLPVAPPVSSSLVLRQQPTPLTLHRCPNGAKEEGEGQGMYAVPPCRVELLLSSVGIRGMSDTMPVPTRITGDDDAVSLTPPAPPCPHHPSNPNARDEGGGANALHHHRSSPSYDSTHTEKEKKEKKKAEETGPLETMGNNMTLSLEKKIKKKEKKKKERINKGREEEKEEEEDGGGGEDPASSGNSTEVHHVHDWVEVPVTGLFGFSLSRFAPSPSSPPHPCSSFSSSPMLEQPTPYDDAIGKEKEGIVGVEDVVGACAPAPFSSPHWVSAPPTARMVVKIPFMHSPWQAPMFSPSSPFFFSPSSSSSSSLLCSRQSLLPLSGHLFHPLGRGCAVGHAQRRAGHFGGGKGAPSLSTTSTAAEAAAATTAAVVVEKEKGEKEIPSFSSVLRSAATSMGIPEWCPYPLRCRVDELRSRLFALLNEEEEEEKGGEHNHSDNSHDDHDGNVPALFSTSSFPSSCLPSFLHTSGRPQQQQQQQPEQEGAPPRRRRPPSFPPGGGREEGGEGGPGAGRILSARQKEALHCYATFCYCLGLGNAVRKRVHASTTGVGNMKSSSTTFAVKRGVEKGMEEEEQPEEAERRRRRLIPMSRTTYPSLSSHAFALSSSSSRTPYSTTPTTARHSNSDILQPEGPLPSKKSLPPIGILFSGGVDCVALAALTHYFLPPGTPIELINVVFGEHPEDAPDRMAAMDAVTELVHFSSSFPSSASSSTTTLLDPNSTPREWRLVLVDVKDKPSAVSSLVRPSALSSSTTTCASGKGMEASSPQSSLLPRVVKKEVEEAVVGVGVGLEGPSLGLASHILDVLCPKKSVMDVDIGTALWYAAQGRGRMQKIFSSPPAPSSSSSPPSADPTTGIPQGTPHVEAAAAAAGGKKTNEEDIPSGEKDLSSTSSPTAAVADPAGIVSALPATTTPSSPFALLRDILIAECYRTGAGPEVPVLLSTLGKEYASTLPAHFRSHGYSTLGTYLDAASRSPKRGGGSGGGEGKKQDLGRKMRKSQWENKNKNENEEERKGSEQEKEKEKEEEEQEGPWIRFDARAGKSSKAVMLVREEDKQKGEQVAMEARKWRLRTWWTPPRPTCTTPTIKGAAAAMQKGREHSPSSSSSPSSSFHPPPHHHLFYTCESKVVLLGIGADEVLGGYTRHRRSFQRRGVAGLLIELQRDFKQLWKRNLGRDDRVVMDSGREGRFPYLDEELLASISTTMETMIQAVCCVSAKQEQKRAKEEEEPSLQSPSQRQGENAQEDGEVREEMWDIIAEAVAAMVDLSCPPGEGDKRVLRDMMNVLGFRGVGRLPKRAIQFGSRVADGHTAGTDLFL